METKTIHNIKLHETIEIKSSPNSFFVTRVAGGWIYVLPRLDCGQMNSVFVPFSD